MARVQRRCARRSCRHVLPSGQRRCPACGGRQVAYVARVRGTDRKEYSRWFTRKIEADRWATTQEGQKQRGNWVSPSAGKKRLDDYANEWLETATYLAPNTRHRYESLLRVHIVPALGPVSVNAIRPSDLRAFVKALTDKGLAPKTVRHAYTLLVGILGTAVEDGLIATVPKPARGRGQRRILPPVPLAKHNYKNHEEIARLATTEPLAPIYGALVYLGAYGALRYGEMAGLRADHVGILQRKVEIVETIDAGEPKWGSSGTIPLPGFVAEELSRHLEEYPPGPDGLVFTAPGGGALRYENFYRRAWIPAVRAAGVAPMTPHDLRHTAVALAIADGAHPREIQELCRHSSFNTTMTIYGGLFPDLAEKLARRLDRKARAAARVAADAAPIRGHGGATVIRLASRKR